MNKIRTWALHLLRWSEKYTRTDMLYLANGSFWTGLGQAVAGGLSFILVIFFANFLPKEIYGTYRYLLSVASILSIFTLTGMNQAVAQAVAVGDDGSLRASVKYQLKWNLLLLAAFWAVGAYYFLNQNYVFALSLFVMGIFSPMTNAFNTFGAYLQGKKDFRLNNIFSIIASVTYTLGMLLAILLSGEVVWLIVAYTLATFIPTALFYFLTLRRYRLAIGMSKDHLVYGKKLTFISFIGQITSQIDSIIINHFWGPAQLAVYSIAFAVPSRATTFTKDWVGIGFPKFATKTPAELDTTFNRRILQGLLIGIIIVVFYIILSPYLFTYLLPKYLDGLFYSQILALTLIFAVPNRYISLLLASQKLSRLIFVSNISQNIIKILMYVVLGIWGGVFGLILTQVLSAMLGTVIGGMIWRWRNYLKIY